MHASQRSRDAGTVKGRGVSFMENERSWRADAITPEQYRQAIAELERPLP